MPYYCNPDGTATTLCVGDVAILLDGTFEMVPTRLMTQLVAEGVLAELDKPMGAAVAPRRHEPAETSAPRKPLGRPPGKPRKK